MTEPQGKAHERPLIQLVKRLLTRQISAFLIIFGRRGTGKTDFALLIAEIAYYVLGIKHIATNIVIFNSPFPIKKITDLDTLTEWAKSNKGSKLYIFDEIAKAMPRRRPMATLTVELLTQFQEIRKFKLHLISTTITEEQSDSGLLDPALIDGYFVKPHFKNPKISTYRDFLEPLSTKLNDIPATEVSFDTWASSPFTLHGVQSKPKFKEEDEATLWELTHGKKAEDLGLHPMQVARLWRKYIKESLESKVHTSH